MATSHFNESLKVAFSDISELPPGIHTWKVTAQFGTSNF